MLQVTNKIELLREYLDILACITGILFGFIILTLAFKFNIGYGFGAVLILISILYLVFRDKLCKMNEMGADLIKRYRITELPIAIITVLIFVTSIILIQTSRGSYGRPLIIFFSMVAISCLIMLEILFMDKQNKRINHLIMIQITFFAFTTSISSVVTYDMIGSDMFTHVVHIDSLADFGNLGGITGSYSNYPLFHTMGAVCKLVTGLGAQNAVVIGAVAPYLIGLWFLYLLASQYFNNLVALLVPLLIAGNKYFLFWGGYPVPFTMILSIYMLSMYMLFHFKERRNNISISIIALVVILYVPFVHPLGAIAIALLLIAVSIPLILFKSVYRFLKPDDITNKLTHITTSAKVFVISSVLVIIVTLSNWIYNGKTLENALMVMRSDVETLSQEGVLTLSTSKPLLIYELDNINLYILYILSGIELLLLLRQLIKRNYLITDAKKFEACLMLFGASVCFLAIGHAFWFLGINFVPHRWVLLGIIPLSFFGALLLNLIISKGRFIALFVCVLLIVSYFSCGLLGNEYNTDNPVYNKEMTVYNLRLSEWDALSFASDYVPFDKDLGITTDWESAPYIEYRSKGYFGGSVRYTSRHRWWDEGFRVYTSHFIIRDIYYERALFPPHKMTRELVNVLNEKPSINRVYQNNQAALYYQTTREVLIPT